MRLRVSRLSRARRENWLNDPPATLEADTFKKVLIPARKGKIRNHFLFLIENSFPLKNSKPIRRGGIVCLIKSSVFWRF